MEGKAKKKDQNAEGVFDMKGAKTKAVTADVMHFVYEAQLARMDEYIKKLFLLCLILIVLLFGTNVAWFAYKMNTQTVDTSRSIELDNTGKMIALKPIYYTTDHEDDVEVVFQAEKVGDSKSERSKKKINLYCFGDFAVAC